MCIVRSVPQLTAQILARVVHGEHHQLAHTNKARRLAARDRVREQASEVQFQIRRAACLYGPMPAGVEL